MKKLSYILALGVIAAGLVLNGCKKKEDPAPDDCASSVYPTTSGSATVAILNYGSSINVAAGDVLSFALQITKGTDRPQKVRIYQSDCANSLGTIVSLAGQPGAENGGEQLDLRNTDDPQIRQFVYTVPTGMSTIYLSIEIDESNSKFTYKKVTLNVSGSGIIDSWTNKTIGSNGSGNPSRMSSGTGQTYTACETAANIDYIDITFANATTVPYKAYFLSNPARYSDFSGSPTAFTATNAAGPCGDGADATPSVRGGATCYFKLAANQSLFSAATDADLSALTVSSSDPQYVEITAAGQVFEFLTTNNRKGLIKVVSATNLASTAGDIVVDIKVQR